MLPSAAEQIPEALPSPPPVLSLDDVDIGLAPDDLDLDADMQDIATPVPRETIVHPRVLFPRDVQVLGNMRNSEIIGDIPFDVTLSPKMNDHSAILPIAASAASAAPPSRECCSNSNSKLSPSCKVKKESLMRERDRECSISIIKESTELAVNDMNNISVKCGSGHWDLALNKYPDRQQLDQLEALNVSDVEFGDEMDVCNNDECSEDE